MNPNTNSQQQKRVYTQKEIAGELNLCAETVSRWTTAGVIPCLRVGRTVRYDLTAVLKAIEKSVEKAEDNK